MKTKLKSLGPALVPAIACLVSPLAAQEGRMEGNGRDLRPLGDLPREKRMAEPAERGERAPSPEEAAEVDRVRRDARRPFLRLTEEGLGELPPEQRLRLRQELERVMEPGERDLLLLSLDARTPPVDAPKWRIGVGAVPVEPVLRSHLDLPEDSGLMVTELIPDGPAARAGLRRDDILVAAGDRKLARLEDLREAVQVAGKAGRPLPLTVIHQGKRKQVRIEPAGPPAEREAAERPRRPEAAPRIMAEMDRRFEAMERRLNEMSERIERQQRMIEQLRSRGPNRRVRPDPPADAPPRERDRQRPDAPDAPRRDRE